MKYIPKTGDKVRVFGMICPEEGGSQKYVEGVAGIVIKVEKDNSLRISVDYTFGPYEGRVIDGIHPRQVKLRKFKKRLNTGQSIWVPKTGQSIWVPKQEPIIGNKQEIMEQGLLEYLKDEPEGLIKIYFDEYVKVIK